MGKESIQKKSFRKMESAMDFIVEQASGNNYIYRGQADASWPLLAKFHRETLSINKTSYEKQELLKCMLMSFRNRCIQHSIIRDIDIPQHDLILIEEIAQHYGMPTRLLDWTYSPYIALCFAYNGISKVKINNKSVALWRLDLDKFQQGIICKGCIDGEDIEDKEKAYRERQESIWHFNRAYKSINERIRKQKGTFLFCGCAAEAVDSFIDNEFPKNTLLKITLPSSLQSTVLIRLSLMGLDSTSLMMDLEGAVNDTVWTYLRNN